MTPRERLIAGIEANGGDASEYRSMSDDEYNALQEREWAEERAAKIQRSSAPRSRKSSLGTSWYDWFRRGTK